MAKCTVNPEITVVRVVKPKSYTLELTEDEAHLILDVVGCICANGHDDIQRITNDIYRALQEKALPLYTYHGKYKELFPDTIKCKRKR